MPLRLFFQNIFNFCDFNCLPIFHDFSTIFFPCFSSGKWGLLCECDCESVQLSLGEINNEYRITMNFDNREICVHFQNECVPSS